MEELTREQPTEEQATVLNATDVICADSDEGSLKGSDTLPGDLGKFKDSKALLDAYNSLQSEFTKKCQQLSALQQEKAEQTTPSRDFEKELEQFLASNSDASDYAGQIMEIVRNDENLQKVDKPFEYAWHKLISSHVSALQKGDVSDPLIDKYVLSNDLTQEKVVENYLKKLSKQGSPVVISSDVGERVSSMSPTAPSTLKDAKKIVENMFR